MAWLDYDGLLYFWQKIKAKLADKVDKVDGKGLSTNDFSAAYKAKLDGIANGANNYSHPTSSGNKHIPAGGSAGQILRWSSDGTAQWGNDNNTTYSAFKGATSSAAGGSGLVPAPATTNATQYLRGDGTWATPPDTKYNNASTSSAGLMSSGDKAKLDGIAANANNYAHPTSAGNKHIPAGGSAGQILRWSADGTAQWGNDNNTTYSDMKGATTEAAGVHFISSDSHSFHPLTVFGQLSCCATSSFKSDASSLSDNSRMACALLFLRPNSSRLCLCRTKPSAISSIVGLFIYFSSVFIMSVFFYQLLACFFSEFNSFFKCVKILCDSFFCDLNTCLFIHI